MKNFILFIKSKSAATAVGYALVAFVIGIGLISGTTRVGQLLSHKVKCIHIAVKTDGIGECDLDPELQLQIVDEFFQRTTTTHGCNGYGSCGHLGNDAIFTAFRSIANYDDDLNHLLVDKPTFDTKGFAVITQKVTDKINEKYKQTKTWEEISSTVSATEIYDTARPEWINMMK